MTTNTKTHRNGWQNESNTDRLIRLGVMIGADIGAYESQGTIQVVWLIIAAIALISGFSGFSLFYKLVGINTLSWSPLALRKRQGYVHKARDHS